MRRPLARAHTFVLRVCVVLYGNTDSIRVRRLERRASRVTCACLLLLPHTGTGRCPLDCWLLRDYVRGARTDKQLLWDHHLQLCASCGAALPDIGDDDDDDLNWRMPHKYSDVFGTRTVIVFIGVIPPHRRRRSNCNYYD